MSDTKRLNDLLAEQMASDEPPEVKYETMLAMAHSVGEDGFDMIADRIRSTALTMTYMFGGYHAERAWLEQRKAVPLLRRIFTPRTPSDAFRRDFTERVRAEARHSTQQGCRTNNEGENT